MTEPESTTLESDSLEKQAAVDTAFLTSSSNASATSLSLTVIHNRTKHPFTLTEQTTVLELKQLLEPLTQVPVGMQKLIYRGLLSDSSELASLHLPPKDAKFMLVGASQSDADHMRKVDAAKTLDGDSESATNGGSSGSGELEWCDQTEHKRVLDRWGKPDNVMVGIMNSEELLAPNESLIGLYDKRGRALRLRIKSDTCELWLATSDVTQKLPLATIHEVLSQPMKDQKEYHIMAFQLGPTPKSRYFVYWMPAQYVESIKTMVLQHKILRSATDHTL